MQLTHTTRWVIVLGLVLVAAVTIGAGIVVVRPTPASAISNGSAVSTTQGFDRCELPSVSNMQTWWNDSPYFWYNVYIGGDEAGCPPGNIGSWLNQVNGQGWNFEYTWVGPQPPCSTGYTNTFSSDPATAYNQGEAQAGDAWNQLQSDGVANSAVNTPVIYDLETAGNGTCQGAINSFIQGWVNSLNTSPAQVPGVYGSICGSNLAALATLNPPPYFIWGADWDNNPNTAVLDDGPGGCGVPNGDWVSQQRLKQYNGDVSQNYGGVTMTVDEDCANSLTTPSGSQAANCN